MMSNAAQQRIHDYFDRNQWLKVLFIFDRMDLVGNDVRSAEWDDRYVIKEFDGRWFSLKYKIEHDWADKRVVLIFDRDKTPQPASEEQMLNFPLLDLLAANLIYQEQDYAAFIQQYHISQVHAPFIKRNITELRTNRITQMLNGYLNDQEFNEDVVKRAIISADLGDKRLLDWETIIIKMIILGLPEEEKGRISFYTRLEKNKDAKAAVDSKLTEIFGRSYNPNTAERMTTIVESLKYNSLTQQLTLSNSDNYRNYKVVGQMRIDMVNKIFDRGTSDRYLAPKFNKAIEILGANIKEDEIIRTYGVDAEYYQLTPAMCWPILHELISQRLKTDPKGIVNRLRQISLQLMNDVEVQRAIAFIEAAATYYEKEKAIGSLKLDRPNDYVGLYSSEFFKLDQFYRIAIEKFHDSLATSLPIEDEINSVKKQIDKDYAHIANLLNYEWLTCVLESGDWFNSLTLQRQDNFYDDEKDPSVKDVIIVCDALRFEVASELMDALNAKRCNAELKPMLAGLPTETKYTKPALLPHNDLRLVGTQMEVDGKVLTTMEQRQEHIRKFRPDAVCIGFDTVMAYNRSQLRELCKSSLVYIFHDSIDEAGHAQSPLEVIRACRNAVNDLATLIPRLNDGALVSSIIVTADHGFLYNDMIFEEKDKHVISEECIEKKSRYFLTNDSSSLTGIVKFPLAEVSGMKSSEPVYVGTPIGTNRLAAQGGGYDFAHGGASLQELIIPVIRSRRIYEEKADHVSCKLLTHDPRIVMNQFQGYILQKEPVTMTRKPVQIKAALYKDGEMVSQEVTLTLSSTDDDPNKRIYPIILNLTRQDVGSLLQLKAFTKEDPLNPVIDEPVKNATLIDQDFEDF